MTVEIGEGYYGSLGLILTVESVSDDWITCRCGSGSVTFPARDAAKWLKRKARDRRPELRGLPGLPEPAFVWLVREDAVLADSETPPQQVSSGGASQDEDLNRHIPS